MGASLIVLSSLFYASYGIWTKLMGNFFGGYTASALRSVVVVLILLPIAIVYSQLEPLNTGTSLSQFLCGRFLSCAFLKSVDAVRWNDYSSSHSKPIIAELAAMHVPFDGTSLYAKPCR